MGQGRQGLRFLMEEASGGLASGGGMEGVFPSGIELLLLGRLLVGAPIGLFRLF